jgi:tetratricopeptide (TPR) repeat protein
MRCLLQTTARVCVCALALFQLAFAQSASNTAQDAPALRARGQASLANGDRIRGMADLNSAVDLKPGDPENYVARARGYLMTGEPNAAVRDFETAINLKLERADVYAGRGAAYLTLGDYPRALDDFDRALKLQRDNAQALKGRGMTRAAMGDNKQAIADLSAALARTPNDAEALVERALAWSATGEDNRAVNDLNAALKLDPANLRALRVRGAVRDRLGDAAGAIEDFTEAIRRDRTDARVFMEGVSLGGGKHGLLVDGLDHADVSLQNCNLSIAGNGISVHGGPLAAAGQSIDGRVVLFSASSGGGEGPQNANGTAFEVTNGGQLLVRDLWYEEGHDLLPADYHHHFLNATDAGVFSFDNGLYASSDYDDDEVIVNNFAGKISLLGLDLLNATLPDNQTKMTITGDGTQTKFLGLGGVLTGTYENNSNHESEK